jgi:hypothetical protein
MTRPHKSRSTVVGAVAILALLLVPAPANSSPPAADEYILSLPGADMSGLAEDRPDRDPDRIRRGGGIVGERTTVPTRLASVGSAVLTPAGALAVGLPALLGGAALLRARRDRR